MHTWVMHAHAHTQITQQVFAASCKTGTWHDSIQVSTNVQLKFTLCVCAWFVILAAYNKQIV